MSASKPRTEEDASSQVARRYTRQQIAYLDAAIFQCHRGPLAPHDRSVMRLHFAEDFDFSADLLAGQDVTLRLPAEKRRSRTEALPEVPTGWTDVTSICPPMTAAQIISVLEMSARTDTEEAAYYLTAGYAEDAIYDMGDALRSRLLIVRIMAAVLVKEGPSRIRLDQDDADWIGPLLDHAADHPAEMCLIPPDHPLGFLYPPAEMSLIPPADPRVRQVARELHHYRGYEGRDDARRWAGMLDDVISGKPAKGGKD